MPESALNSEISPPLLPSSSSHSHFLPLLDAANTQHLLNNSVFFNAFFSVKQKGVISAQSVSPLGSFLASQN